MPEEVPEELRDVLTEDVVPLLPMIFEQALASLPPEHIEKMARDRDQENVALGLDDVMNADQEITDAFLQNVWAMLNQPPEYTEHGIRSVAAMQAYEDTGDPRLLDEAISRIERIRAHPVFEVDHEQARAVVLSNSAACYQRRYELTGDVADLELALGLAQRVVAETPDGHPLRPGRLQNRANALSLRYELSGDADDVHCAVADLREAVATTPALSPGLHGYLDNLGNSLRKLYAREGDLVILDEALGAYWQAVTRTPEGHPDLPNFLNNLGTGYKDRFYRTKDKGDFDEALRLFERAVELARPGAPGYVLSLANLGTALRTKFLYTRQLPDLNRAVDVLRRVVDNAPDEPVKRAGFLSGLGGALLTRAETNRDLGDLEEAERLLRRSVSLVPEGSPEMVVALNNLAYGLALHYDLTRDADVLEVARNTSERACRVSLDSGMDPQEGLRCARSWGNWEFGHGAWAEAVRAYGYAERISERLLRTQLFRGGKEAWLADIQGIPARAAFALAETGNLPGAVTVLERGRARLLTEAHDRDRADLERLRESGREDLYARYRSTVGRWAALLDLASAPSEARSAGSPDPTDMIEALRAASRELDAVTEEVHGVPGYELFRLPASFEEILGVARHAPLVYLATTPAGSLALGVTADGVEAEWLDVTEQELNDLLMELGPEGGPNGEPHMSPLVGGYVYAQVVDPRHLGEALEKILPVLGERIMATVAERLRSADASEVTLIPNGQLGSVPLHAAGYEVDGRSVCFLDEFDVSYAPTARSLGVARRSLAHGPVEPYLVGVGNPLPTSGDPLRWAEFELEAIAGLFGGARPLYGRAATKAALEGAMNDATHLHFACHGYFDIAHPPNSGLILADDEELTLAELLHGRVKVPDARLAVLSACQSAITASGGLPDEYVGLPVGLLQAGISGVVGTLWPVEDHKTALLMVRFYELHLAGDKNTGEGPMQPARALCEAQRWLRRLGGRGLLDFLKDHPEVDRALRNALCGRPGDSVSRAIHDPSSQPDAPLFAEEPALWAPFVLVGA